MLRIGVVEEVLSSCFKPVPTPARSTGKSVISVKYVTFRPVIHVVEGPLTNSTLGSWQPKLAILDETVSS